MEGAESIGEEEGFFEGELEVLLVGDVFLMDISWSKRCRVSRYVACCSVGLRNLRGCSPLLHQFSRPCSSYHLFNRSANTFSKFTKRLATYRNFVTRRL